MEKSDVDFKTLPDAPGVYRFIGPKRHDFVKDSAPNEVLYVGKATSLRDRVKSYFSKDLAEMRSPLIEKIVRDAVRIDIEETDSVLEALILEAKLIKKFQPTGNTEQKDNKSWNYLVITNERFPRVLVARERELKTKFSSNTIKELFGPFPSSGQLKEALKIVRRIFPFFDPPFSIMGDVERQALTRAQEKTVRFNQSIGLYPNFDVSQLTVADERAYRKTIRAIIDLFSARKEIVIKRLEREMHTVAKNQEFEKAELLKRKVFALRHIQDITLIKEELKRPDAASFRIEAYDVAHIRGEAPRGVMVVLEDGEPQKSDYRLFTIRTIRGPEMLDVGRPTFRGDDYAGLEELLTRRAQHREWPYPQLVVIDGGKAHLNRAKKILKRVGMGVEAVAVVKDERHRPREILGSAKTAFTHEADILLANAEAHRFAITKHRRALAHKKINTN